MRRVLLTGPVGRLAEYARAAAEAGWEALEHPLLAIEPVAFDPAHVAGGRFDWICVTSSNALPYLEAALEADPSLRSARAAVVGSKTADSVRATGLEVALGPEPDAAALERSLRSEVRGGERVLWPRGDRSDDLARGLREARIEVCDPVAYSSTERPSGQERPPPSDAVFFASPSAVRAWHALPETGERRTAIAIGATTFHALLQETEPRFFDTISLPQPTPEALGFVLAHLELEKSP